MPRSTSFVFLVDLKSSQEELRWHWCTDFFHMFFSLPFDCSSPCSKFVLYFSLLSSPRIWSRLSSPWRRKKGNWIGLQKSKSMPTNLNVIISYRWFFFLKNKTLSASVCCRNSEKKKRKKKSTPLNICRNWKATCIPHFYLKTNLIHLKNQVFKFWMWTILMAYVSRNHLQFAQWSWSNNNEVFKLAFK